MTLFKCKMCGGDLNIENGTTVCECEYCGTKQTLPKLDDEKRINLYERANHFRRNNEFDKAMGIYEMILGEDNSDSEAYWSIVLCRYGIEYVDDPATHKKVPTVNRAQLTSIFNDNDYQKAIVNADGYQRDVYESEAKVIDEIQKGILEISDKEEPFDVFICYKETDTQGRRTHDSVYAQDIYNSLTREGYRVFFSRITFEDKIGTAYEPYIFAALNSAKVMLVVGTSAENMNAVWVKNEWSRYLALVKQDNSKTLIPCYKDMSPYDMPEEFAFLQAQDMGKIGFMQDLLHGVQKVVSKDSTVKETVVINNSNSSVEPLLKRAFMFLEDKDWNSANEYCEKILDQEPENAMAYLGKLMADLKVSKQEELADCKCKFNDNINYEKAVRFADKKLANELAGYIDFIIERNEQERIKKVYTEALKLMNTAHSEKQFKDAANAFKSIVDYKDTQSLEHQCLEKAEIARKDEIYSYAKKKIAENTIDSFETAIKKLEIISGWKDSGELIDYCKQKIEELKIKEENERLEKERQSEIEQREKIRKGKKVKIVISIIIVIVLASVIIIKTLVIPPVRYQSALDLMEEKQYNDAISVFESLDDYKDSKNYLKEAKYSNAVKVFESGDYSSEIDTFKNFGDYKNSKNYIIYYDAINCSNLNESLEKFKSLPDTMYDVRERIAFLENLKNIEGNYRAKSIEGTVGSGIRATLYFENAVASITLENGNAIFDFTYDDYYYVEQNLYEYTSECKTEIDYTTEKNITFTGKSNFNDDFSYDSGKITLVISNVYNNGYGDDIITFSK